MYPEHRILIPINKLPSYQIRGGPRYFAKPYLDAGLLFKALDRHSALITGIEGYEILCANSTVDPRAMHYMLPLIEGLVSIEASASIAAQPLFSQVQQQDPSLNGKNSEPGG